MDERDYNRIKNTLIVLTIAGLSKAFIAGRIERFQAPGIPEAIATSIITPEIEWSSLPALEKINRLEFKQYPLIPDFNPRNELISSVAQFYCEQTVCQKKADDMARNVFFVDPNELIPQLEKENDRKYTEDEKENERKTRLEITRENGNAYVNSELFNNIVETVKTNNPELLKQLKGRDLETFLLKSLLFHTYSHVNESHKTNEFEPFSLSLSYEPGLISFGKLVGFKFYGQKKDGTPAYLIGASEAATELAAIIIGTKTSGYISINRDYEGGADFIQTLNRKAGVSNAEFLEYYHGNKPINDLLRRWSSKGNEKDSVMALATIALRVDGLASQKDAEAAINRFLEGK